VSAVSVTDQVRALEALGLEGLREEWRRRYGPPPTMRSPDLLRRNLAWRIQAEAFGGLDDWTLKALFGRTALHAPASVGTRLAREWRGVRHEVEVVADGVRYREKLYASLSEVARTITGVRWNGPRFFGLREQTS
jgi:hypothetical protein